MKDLNSFEDRYLFHRKDIQAATIPRPFRVWGHKCQWNTDTFPFPIFDWEGISAFFRRHFECMGKSYRTETQ